MAGGGPGVRPLILWSICHRFPEACFAGALPPATFRPFRQTIKKASERSSTSGENGDEEEGNAVRQQERKAMRGQRPVPALPTLARAKLYADAQNAALLPITMPGDRLLAAEQCGCG